MSIESLIIYTKTDEAPALATYSLLPIIKMFSKHANIDIGIRDISLAGRIISSFPESLTDKQKINDDLSVLGELVKNSDSNIIKLPNISASIPQLKSAITELQSQGFNIPSYPEKINNQKEKEIHKKYQKILGSAVNPVLREGNSDRRVASAVKNYAKNNPHTMGDWNSDSKTSVAHMDDGDFFASEKSKLLKKPDKLKIILKDVNGKISTLKELVETDSNEIIDAAKIDINKLISFFKQEFNVAKNQNVLLSLHLKATMMKVSDPIIFGHAVKTFYSDVFESHKDIIQKYEVNERNGIGDLYEKLDKLPPDEKAIIEKDIKRIYEIQPSLAMVDSDKGITNLHVPSNVIIDASMPAAIRSSGKMWGPDGKLRDTRALIPDRCYARIYQEIINFCKKNGAFDVTSMGNVSNVGLMAKKAQEYGSHDKTFEIPFDGTVEVIDQNGEVLINHTVNKGDIWRMCQTKDKSIRNWVELAIERAEITKSDTIFWLDPERSHDKLLITIVETILTQKNINSNIQIMAPHDAMRKTLDIINSGKDVISVTGNVLRDYLTDLFPILEVGTSAKMLSIVPLMNGGGLFETGAGGSAPKHVEQFLDENHLRWDSLGEFLALAVSLEHFSQVHNHPKAAIIGAALDDATEHFLLEKKSPSRKVNELDNRGSHYYLALFWAEALANQEADLELKLAFKKIYDQLKSNEDKIIGELIAVQGKSIDIGGYYLPDEEKIQKAMRPSETFNAILDQ